MQYPVIPSDSHATQAFIRFKQGPAELLDEYLNCVSELLSELYHTSDMSRILVQGLNHYTVMYSLNCRNLKDIVVGH